MDKILKARDIIDSETEGMADVMKEDMTEEMTPATALRAEETLLLMAFHTETIVS